MSDELVDVGKAIALDEPKEELPDVLPILPLRDTVVYPQTVAPLAVGQERSLRLVDHVQSGNRLFGLVAVRDPKVERGEPENVFDIGTTASIQQLLKVPDGTVRLLVQGIERVRIVEFVQREPYLAARIERLPEEVEQGVEVEALIRSAQSLFQRLVNASPTLPDELVTAAINIEDPLHLCYFIANNLRLEHAQRQEFLTIDSLKAKLSWLSTSLHREVELLELGKRIQSEAQENMSRAQREYFLREQLKAIRKELGEEDDEESEVNALREKIAEAAMPDEARREAERELNRLEKLPAASPEHSVIRTYLDWLTVLPWAKSSGGEIDVKRSREILDEDHYGLQRVKERILEYLAVRRLKEERRAKGQEEQPSDGVVTREPHDREPILCFVGPPGVGKTSLGQSIARAMGRKFVRMSLGGIRDEAEIRGHRRTYVGAMPGRFIQAIRRAEVNDPVFMLDEVDKVGSDWRGDPSSALLEVLDPEQNKDFRDHYLDVPFDLQKVMFITTANTLETIPPPLRDRMEILQLPGYTEVEKVRIAESYLVPKQVKSHGLTDDDISFDESALRAIIEDYTREAGVRNLEREIASVCRKVATQIAEGSTAKVEVDAAKVRELLGRARYFGEVVERIDRPGVATGLVYTPVGGDIIFIEAGLMPGKKTLQLTGSLGDQMRESAEAALSFVRGRARHYGIDPLFFEKNDIHIHVPAGAVPKDGPSAGITMVTALVSLLTGRLVRSDVAMTGEITLRGKVLPIGGVKEKTLGAHRAGIRTIIMPKRNEHDLEELPPELRSELKFIFVESADEAIDAALVESVSSDAESVESAMPEGALVARHPDVPSQTA